MELLQLISANNSAGGVRAREHHRRDDVLGADRDRCAACRAAHTLVLINGKRVNGFAGEIQGVQGVNLAVIPFSAIERVEILKDGASAVYGSDAIAGVINFIMRSDYHGAEATAYYGAPTRSGGGDAGEVQRLAGFGDLNKDRYNVFLGASYDHQKPLDQKDRNFSNDSTDRFLRTWRLRRLEQHVPGQLHDRRHRHSRRDPDVRARRPYATFFAELGGCFFDPAQRRACEAIPDNKNTNFFGRASSSSPTTGRPMARRCTAKDENHFIIQPVPISNVFVYGPNGDIPVDGHHAAGQPVLPARGCDRGRRRRPAAQRALSRGAATATATRPTPTRATSSWAA